MSANDATLSQLPQPSAIRQHMGRLYRELVLLRRLLRLSQAVRAEREQQSEPAVRGNPEQRTS